MYVAGIFANPDIPAFQVLSIQLLSPAAQTTWREFHSYTTESPSFSFLSLLYLYETRTDNIKSLGLQKTLVWTSLGEVALHDDHGWSRPGVRIFLPSKSWQKQTCRWKESRKAPQFYRPSSTTVGMPTKLASFHESAQCQALPAHYLHWTKSFNALNLHCSAQLLTISAVLAWRMRR